MDGGEGEELAQVADIGFERQRGHAAFAREMLEPRFGEASEFGVGMRKRWRIQREGAYGGRGVA